MDRPRAALLNLSATGSLVLGLLGVWSPALWHEVLAPLSRTVLFEPTQALGLLMAVRALATLGSLRRPALRPGLCLWWATDLALVLLLWIRIPPAFPRTHLTFLFVCALASLAVFCLYSRRPPPDLDPLAR